MKKQAYETKLSFEERYKKKKSVEYTATKHKTISIARNWTKPTECRKTNRTNSTHVMFIIRYLQSFECNVSVTAMQQQYTNVKK